MIESLLPFHGFGPRSYIEYSRLPCISAGFPPSATRRTRLVGVYSPLGNNPSPPNLSNLSLSSSSGSRSIHYLSIFHGHCSLEIKNIIPDTFFFCFFFFYINVNLKLNKIQYSVPSIAEKDMTSSGSGYERHLQFL